MQMDNRIELSWVEGRAWQATTRGLTVVGDSTREHGGKNRGMTPVEMMVAALGLCTGIELSYYTERHPGVDLSQIRMALTWEDAGERPSRVGTIRLHVTLPPGLSEEERDTLTRVVHACKVRRSLEHGVEIATTVE